MGINVRAWTAVTRRIDDVENLRQEIERERRRKEKEKKKREREERERRKKK